MRTWGRKIHEYQVPTAGAGAGCGGNSSFNPGAQAHGGAEKVHLTVPDDQAVGRGLANLQKHIENVRKFGLSPVVALNRFPTDAEDEIEVVKSFCREMGT